MRPNGQRCLPTQLGRRPISISAAPATNSANASSAWRLTGTPVLASVVVVVDDVVDPVATPFVDDVERAAVVAVPLPDVVAVARRPVVVTEAETEDD